MMSVFHRVVHLKLIYSRFGRAVILLYRASFLPEWSYDVSISQGCTPFIVFFIGLGEPSYFYIEPVFFLKGLMMSVFHRAVHL